MNRVELKIYYREGNVTKVRCTVNKWKFQDTMMGEQFITLNITSEVPIDFAVGDFCTFRGETYTLNYVPSVTQKARSKERQDSYTYENVKFESFQEELTRCLMLDITPTTGDYVAALGTNYTGSSKFQLFCGETSANGSTLTAVCALAAKMQANLDRMFPTNGWKIFVDTTSTYLNTAGDAVLVTHTEDKVLSFDNTTVAKALEEVHNTFDLDYCIRGRSIYIGYNLKNLTSDNDNETFAFGYGKGYPTRENQNKALFQIKRIANSQQKVVTRLRALGSTKNMPYRYYNSKYNLSQSLFPTNLQLPDTFATPAVKAANNALRDSTLRAVKGDTNDAYIDKNDDAENCAEGIREDSARWDGTNSELPEIYPTIEEATYGELRNALVQDQDGQTGVSSFPNYGASERIDKMLAIGYKDGNTLVDDANKGDGILPESGISARGIPRSANIGLTSLSYNTRNFGDFSSRGGVYAGPERTLFTIQGVSAGKYAMAPTIGAVLYGFSISCYRDGVSADVGYIITVKQKNLQTGSTTTIATYTSDYQSISRGDGILEMELPEIPDVKNGANAKVSEVRVTALSDITVTFTPIMRNIHVPSGFTDNFSLSYKVGNSRLDHTVTYDPEYNWIPLDDTDSVSETFHVFIQDMGFDLQACWTDDTPVVAMKSGRCVGREFEIGENIEKVTHNGKKGYMLTLKRATDNTLNTYYPSATDPIAAGDYFVLLNISMPDVYVKMAEVRLLRAATEYLADNCETQFTYQPSIDDIYLQRNYDNMVKAGTPQSSIFWRLYAGLKFTFRGIPASEDSPAPLADITIEQVSISMGEGLTPKVELKLNDDVQQSTIQKLTTSVDRIYNGSIFSSGSGGSGGGGAMSAALLSILQSEGEKLFLSKKHDDVAEGKITFNDVVTHNETLKAKRGLRVGNFNSRLLGSGALIDEEGNAEFESIYSRNFISTPEFRFNRVNVTEGEQWCTNGYGTIKEVEIIDETTGYITLKLEENDYASIAEGDICRGIYNDIAHEYETASLDDDTALYAGGNESNVEGFGFSSKEGFFTSYFWVRQMITNQKGECKFLYELRNTNTPHPCEFMKFAQYGSFTNSERRSSSYATSIGHYYEMVLDGVSTWKIKSANVVYRKGYLGNMTVTLKNGHEAELQGYGLYVQDNVYFGNAVVQLDPETIADLQDALNSYTVDFSGYVDVVTVDDVGNVIGGLWTLSGDNDEYRSYRIHSAITVRKSGTPLVIAADDADAGEGTYKIYAQPKGCSCIIENSTIYITGINNIKDGVAGSADDANFDYAAMRAMEGCSVDLIIDCEGKGSIVKNFPVTIKHDAQPFVGADISNEFSAVSWNTKTQSYVGLPIVFDMKMWHNNEVLDIAAVANVSLTAATAGITLVNGAAPATPASASIYYTKEIITSNGHKFARITLTAIGKDVPSVIDLDLTCTAVYSGVSYERTLRHTINKSTDTNVYSLLPSKDEILYNKNTNSLSADNVTCSVICDSSDDNHYTVGYSDFATHKVVLYYRRFYTDGTSDADETLYNNNAIPIASNFSEVRFYLYGLTNGSVDRGIVHDTESVSIIAEGLDGKGVEYIFITKNDWDGTDANKPTIYDVAADRQVDNYCPYTDAQHTEQWTDEPTGIGANHKYEFYAQRKKVNGVWQPFGDVKLWDRYAVDGVTPYLIDLSNEQSFVNCDGAGSILSGASYETSNLMLFKGSSYAFTDFNIRITPTNITCNGNTSYFDLTESQKSTAQSNGYFTLTPSAITSNSAQITIRATLKTNTSIVLVAVYKINKNIAGQNGVIYSLIPNLNVIHKNNKGEFLDTSLYVKVKKTVGTTTSILETYKAIADEGLTIDYQNSVGTTTLVASGASSTSAVSVASSNFVGGTNGLYGVLRLKQSSTIVDTERINVVVDGDDGVNYFIDANPNSVTIPTDASQATYSGVIKFFKNVGDEISPVQWFSAMYVRKLDGTRRFVAGNHTFYGYGTDDSPITANVTTDDDVIEIFCIEEANSSNLLTDYVIKKEIAIYKNGDTGPEGDDAVNYYLTSSINSIIRDQYGNYAGTARPVITAWKKVGDAAAVRLVDITTPAVAEGFTINAYEMGGSSVAYTNTSTTGVLTCAEPYSYVDRLEVELVKDSKTYATMSIPIITEHQGDAGSDGVFPRDCGLFDADIATNQTYGYAGYIYRKVNNMVIRDMVRYEIGGVMYGFMVKTKSSSTLVTAAPTSVSGDSNWECTGIVRTIIANTIFGTNANIGGFMASNQRLVSSNVAYRVVYKGSYSSSTEYGEVVSSNIYQRQMVLYNDEYWVVRAGKTSFTGQTPSDNSVYWRKATTKEIAIEKTLDSYVDILSFRIDGIQNEIEMIANDDSAWIVDKNGVQTLGFIDGKRVVFDPVSKEINIYNDLGVLATTLTGDTYDDLGAIFGDSTGNLSLNSYKSGSAQVSNGGSKVIDNQTEATRTMSTFSTASACRLTFNGTLSATGSRTQKSMSGNSEPQTLNPHIAPIATIDDGSGYYSIINWAQVTLRIVSYKDSTKTTYIKTTTVASASSLHSTSGYGTKNVTMSNKSVDLPAGYHEVQVYYYGVVYAGQDYTTSVSLQWNVTSASYVSDVYLSRLFANGLTYGSSLNNFFALLNISSKIFMKAVTSDSSANLYGFALDAEGFKVQRKNITGKVFPTIYYGLVNWTAKETFSISTYYSFDGNSPTLSRVATGSDGQMKLTFPSSWSNLGLSFSTAIINLVGYNNSCRNVHVISFTSTQIIVEGNDDTSNNYTSFAIEIKYIG